jgi:hypothetical protein
MKLYHVGSGEHVTLRAGCPLSQACLATTNADDLVAQTPFSFLLNLLLYLFSRLFLIDICAIWPLPSFTSSSLRGKSQRCPSMAPVSLCLSLKKKSFSPITLENPATLTSSYSTAHLEKVCHIPDITVGRAHIILASSHPCRAQG